MTPRPRVFAYATICVLSAIGYGAASVFVHSDHSPDDLYLYLGLFSTLALLWAAALALANRAPPTRRLIFAAALAFRLLLLPAGFDTETGSFRRLLLYDDDIWRYLWEGHTWFAGINPLTTPPQDLEEYELEIQDPSLHQRLYPDPVWGKIYDNIGYREHASPYPYTAQAVFALSHVLRPGSVVVFKLLMLAFDMGALWLLALLCRRLASDDFPLVAYGWNPLVIKEFAGSAHLDAVLVFFVLAALCSMSKGRASGLMALAALVKPTPLLFVPALFRRWGWAGAVAPLVALGLIAIDPPGGMQAYAAEWSFNPALARLLPIHRPTEILFPLVAVGAFSIWLYRKDDGSLDYLIRTGLWLFGVFLLCTPMLAPWYLTWIIPFAALTRAAFWLALSGSVFLSYHVYLSMQEDPWFVAAEFTLPVLIWAWARWRRPTAKQTSSLQAPAASTQG